MIFACVCVCACEKKKTVDDVHDVHRFNPALHAGVPRRARQGGGD